MSVKKNFEIVALLEQQDKLFVKEGKSKPSSANVVAFVAELENLGYVPTSDVLKALNTRNNKQLKSLHKIAVKTLSAKLGANKKYNPLFSNFPEDVPNDYTYYFNRVNNVWQSLMNQQNQNMQFSSGATTLSCGCAVDTTLFDITQFNACPVCQNQTDEQHQNAKSNVGNTGVSAKDYRVLELGTQEDIYTLFKNLVASKTSITESSKEFILNAFEKYGTALLHHLPKDIHMKETLSFVGKELVNRMDRDLVVSVLSTYFTTATDVLRLAVAFSGGDESLAENTRFKLTNKQRKAVMGFLDKVNNPEEDMLRHAGAWVRLGEVLHVGAYKHRFPNAFKAMDTLRNRPETIETFNSKVEARIAGNKTTEAVKLLETRPGDFARRLDKVLRGLTPARQKTVANKFVKVADNVSTSVLLVLRSHLQNRDTQSKQRYFIPKGNVAKVQYMPDDRLTISKDAIDIVCNGIDKVLEDRFAEYGDLGNVYVDEEALKKIMVPLKQRSSGNSSVKLERGTRIPLEENTKYIRLFQYWKETADRVDLDISASILEKDYTTIGTVAYNCYSDTDGMSFSGDITSAPRGAAEFIDIDLDEFTRNNPEAKFITLVATSYTGQGFDEFEALGGFMEFTKKPEGELVDPSAISNKYDISGSNTVTYSLILDVDNREVIWLNVNCGKAACYTVSAMGDINSFLTMMGVEAKDTTPNMADLIRYHVKNRAASVDVEYDENKEYDFVFDAEFAKDFEDIQANWL